MINGRYLLHNKLGQGGMGIVHRATDRLTGETVALKQVFLPVEQLMFSSRPASQTNRELRLALAHEFQTLAGLRHPNIISVLDYGFDKNGQPFFTMSYLENAQTILVAANGRSVPEKVALLIQMLEALAYLHRRGILHRDLKPDNVLVVGNTVRVLDFGLAAAKEQATDSVGSWLYMAPEVLLGQPATEASDLYTVGVLAYRLLAGTHPFSIYAEDVIGEILDGEPDWSKVQGGGELTAVISTLLSKQPANRYATANDTIIALYQALGQTVPEETAVIRESYLQAATFVGRKAELSQLQAALEQAKAGHSAVWLVGGESGVGKSRLLDELRTIALVSGWQVITGQAVAEGGIPYQLWRNVIPHLVLTTDISDLEASVLREIMPSIEQFLGRDIAPAPEMTGEATQQRLALTIIEILKQQGQPTLLILEDLQWAGESLLPLQQMLKMVEQFMNVMVVATYRNDEQPNLPETLAGAQVLSLSRLADTAVAELSKAMLGEQNIHPDLVTLLQQETEGNTFFMVEVMRALAEEAGQLADVGAMILPKGILTSGMSQLLERRLQKMPTSDQSLLQLAAVAGRQINQRLLQTLAPTVAIENWLQRGNEAAVLTVRETQWQFSHDKLREALLTQLTPDQRRDSHRQVALALEALYPEDAAYHAVLLAHWQAAEDKEKVLVYLVLVVKYLVEVSADYEQADALRERSLTLLPPDDKRHVSLLTFLADAAWRQGNYEEMRRKAQQGRDLALQIDAPEGLVKSLNQMGYAAYELGDYETGQNYLQQSLAIAQTNDDQWGIADNLNCLGVIAYVQGNYDVARDYELQALATAQAIGDQETAGYSLACLGEIAFSYADYDAARHYFQQCLGIMEVSGDQRGMIETLNSLGGIAITLGDYANANDHLQESLAIGRAINAQQNVGACLSNLGLIAYYQGRYDAALAYVQESLVIYEATGDQFYLATSTCNLGQIMGQQGTYAAAYDYLQQSLDITQTLSYQLGIANAHTQLGSFYFEQRVYDQALDHLQQGLQIHLARKLWLGIGEVYGYVALSQVALGQYAAAWNTVLSHFQLQQEMKADTSNGLVHLAVAQLLAAIQFGQAGAQETIEVVTALTQLMPTPTVYLEVALALVTRHHIHLRILMAYGRYLLQTDQTEAARIKLEAAKSMAVKSELDHKLQEIDRLLGVLRDE